MTMRRRKRAREEVNLARHLYVYDGRGYEGELELFQRAHVAAGAAEAADLPGLCPRFLYRVVDADAADGPLITDDEIAVRRYLASHPAAAVSIVPMTRQGDRVTAGARSATP